jgi:hypothetical protein
MTDDQLKAAERRGYSKGYIAGRSRKQREISLERARREKQAFLDRAFLAILPAAMNADNWTSGGKPIVSTVDRVKLAASWAREALLQRPLA